MRTHRQLVVYQSILQVLHEPGCPFCKFLKEYQAGRLQKRSESETHRLCNFHAWGLAAVQDAPAAAQAFIGMLSEPESIANGTQACDVCNEVESGRGSAHSGDGHLPPSTRCGRLAANGSCSVHPACNETSAPSAAYSRVEDRYYRAELPPATEGRSGSVAQRTRYGSSRMGRAWTGRRVSGFATRITSVREGKC